ncbi:TPA: hypothetical protein U2B00_001974 [Streptococcus suis]|nr:hypothetical protein [Streptococcus suis]
MTKIIGFGRCFGKTTMAILESHATGHYIVCANRKMADDTLLGCPVETITFNSPHVITEKDRYDEEIAELKKELAACYREKEEDQVAIETLKDKCVDLMLENADYVWDEIARETAKKRANTRKWRAK